MRFSPRAFGLFPLLLFSFDSAADPFALEEEFLTDIPVVLTVARLPQKQSELPASVTVIDREMIEASGAIDIPDLLRLAAGFQVGHSNHEGVRTAVTYHGVSDNYARRLQVLVDGRSVYNPATGGVEWSDLLVQLEDIARIEVTRGPNGVAYGANALVGVVNIITRHPSELPRAMVKQTLGEAGYRRSFGRLAFNSGNLSQRLSLFHESTEGLRDIGGRRGTPQEVNDDHRLQGVTWTGEYRAGINDYLSFGAGHATGEAQRGESDSLVDYTRDRELTNSYLQFRWRHVVSSAEEFKLNLYHQRYELDDAYPSAEPLSGILSEMLGAPVTPAFVPAAMVLAGLPPVDDQFLDLDIGLTTERTNLELEHIFAPADNWRVVWGGEARLDRVRAPGYLGTDSTYENRTWRLFFNNEIRPAERWIVNAGLMAERDHLTDSRFSPRFAINRLLGRNHYLRASHTTAYRTPTALEAHADFALRVEGATLDVLYVSPTPPEDERIRAVELALGGALADPALQYEVKLFEERISNMMVSVKDNDYPDPDGWAYRFQTGGNATTRGAEVQLRLRPDPATSLSLAYSWATTTGSVLEEVGPAGVVEYRDAGRSTPRSTFRLLMSHRFPGGSVAGLGFHRLSSMRWLGPGNETGGFSTIDLTWRRPFRGPGLDGSINLALRDFGSEFFDFRDRTYREPRAYLGVELQF